MDENLKKGDRIYLKTNPKTMGVIVAISGSTCQVALDHNPQYQHHFLLEEVKKSSEFMITFDGCMSGCPHCMDKRTVVTCKKANKNISVGIYQGQRKHPYWCPLIPKQDSDTDESEDTDMIMTSEQCKEVALTLVRLTGRKDVKFNGLDNLFYIYGDGLMSGPITSDESIRILKSDITTALAEHSELLVASKMLYDRIQKARSLLLELED